MDCGGIGGWSIDSLGISSEFVGVVEVEEEDAVDGTEDTGGPDGAADGDEAGDCIGLVACCFRFGASVSFDAKWRSFCSPPVRWGGCDGAFAESEDNELLGETPLSGSRPKSSGE